MKKSKNAARKHAEAIPQKLTARALLHSGLVGMWKDRKDIKDSAKFARELRERAQKR